MGGWKLVIILLFHVITMTAAVKVDHQGVQPEEKMFSLLGPADSDHGQNLSTLHLNGPATSLVDAMGPLVVHEDGSLSRVANWAQMTDAEKETTKRVLSKRNAMRLAKLKVNPLLAPLTAPHCHLHVTSFVFGNRMD